MKLKFSQNRYNRALFAVPEITSTETDLLVFHTLSRVKSKEPYRFIVKWYFRQMKIVVVAHFDERNSTESLIFSK